MQPNAQNCADSAPERSTRLPRRPASLASSQTYLNSRKLHADEKVVFEGALKIEDRNAALQGQILLKDRYALLTQSRLLVFKNVRDSKRERHSDALAVYPIAHASFSEHEAPALSEANFSSCKAFQARFDSLQNYRKFVRMSFQVSHHIDGSIGIHRRNHSRTNSQGKAGLTEQRQGSVHNKDFYFGKTTEIWLQELLMAKKRLQDLIIAQQ